MKPEPLKNKRLTTEMDGKSGDCCYWEKDIKSAVEWLKAKIHEWDASGDIWAELVPLIDKAFEDCIK